LKRLALPLALYLAFLIETNYVDEHIGYLVSLGPVERLGRYLGW
jgi:hypothetical protein